MKYRIRHRGNYFYPEYRNFFGWFPICIERIVTEGFGSFPVNLTANEDVAKTAIVKHKLSKVSRKEREDKEKKEILEETVRYY